MLSREEAGTLESALLAAERSGHPVKDALDLVRRETVLDGRPRAAGLTARETQFLGLLILGRDAREIAEEFAIDRKTVDTHRGNLLRKLNLRGVLELALWALHHGWMGTDDLHLVWSRPRRDRSGIDLANPADEATP